MTKDCALNYEFCTWKLQAQYMHVVYINCSECQNKNKKLCTEIVICFCFDIESNLCTQHVSTELVVFMYRTRNSMNNLLSYCWLVDARINATEKDLPV